MIDIDKIRAAAAGWKYGCGALKTETLVALLDEVELHRKRHIEEERAMRVADLPETRAHSLNEQETCRGERGDIPSIASALATSVSPREPMSRE